MYEIDFHPGFFKDLKRLTRPEKESVAKHIYRLKQTPSHFLHLSGIENCYRIRIGNLRLVYMLKEDKITILIVYKRDKVYDLLHQRLYTLERKLKCTRRGSD